MRIKKGERDKWYCYVCGKLIERKFILWSLNKDTDRVFLVHGGICYQQVDHKGEFIRLIKKSQEMR